VLTPLASVPGRLTGSNFNNQTLSPDSRQSSRRGPSGPPPGARQIPVLGLAPTHWHALCPLQCMRTTSAQRCTSFTLCLALAFWSVEALAIPEQESLENLSRDTAEVFVSYVYQTGHPPDADDLLSAACAQCRRMGYAKAVRSVSPTLKQCIAFGTSRATCVREMATDKFSCTHYDS